ncbi:MAG TPA: DUF4910 domain-containing protein [Candidatus Binatia bacterium]|jgi:aminopeptidase-like protein|nr:DUF4910 domain-containing protein [Candidatus Binatia bacterium]
MLEQLISRLDIVATGQQLHRLVSDLYPICRSISGDGVRQTLDRLRQEIPLEIQEIPSGTDVFDWKIPREWNINDAYIKDSRGVRIVDFNRSNLHVVSYSVPVRKKVSLEELKSHLFTIPDQPDWIPYRTSYYNETWGFCITHNQLRSMTDREYEVCIDSTLEDGHLTYGECFFPGETRDEILISNHICHPSLANDNLAGIAISSLLAQMLASAPRRYSYRFLFVPGTIGSITWLCLHEAQVANIRHGIVLACAGDAGCPTYKRSRQGNAEIDRAMIQILKESGGSHEILDFSPYGYDERQYCSPGFDLPVGCFMRTPHSQYPEYHTSADDLSFVKAASLGDSLAKCLSAIAILEGNRTYLNQNPKCEPQLGKRGLYSSFGGATDRKQREMAMLWVLNYSDGKNSLLDICEKSRLPFARVREAAVALEEHGLLKEASAAD